MDNRKYKILIIILLVSFLVKNSSSQNVYISTEDGGIFRLNFDECKLDSITKIKTQIFDIALDRKGDLYGISRLGNFFKIDTINGDFEIIHDFQSGIMNSLVISPQEIALTMGLSNQIHSFDLNTKKSSIIGSLPSSAAGDLVYINNVLYSLLKDNILMRVDLDSLDESYEVISNNSIDIIFGLFSYGQNCNDYNTYAVTGNLGEIYKINLNEKIYEFHCNLNKSISGAASDIHFKYPIIINSFSFDSKCEEPTGALKIELLDESELAEVYINDQYVEPKLTYENLESGIYNLILVNAYDCEVEHDFEIYQTNCPLYIPNIFSPNSDGINDIFQIHSHPNFEGKCKTFEIFDRWGNKMISTHNIELENVNWDGSVNGSKALNGIYAYFIQIEYRNGSIIKYAGEISLVK
ncbi:MAG: gliding motility-associated-like protein [Ulvibacter sp.]|jgi:gliding motility-associated-like protein